VLFKVHLLMLPNHHAKLQETNNFLKLRFWTIFFI